MKPLHWKITNYTEHYAADTKKLLCSEFCPNSVLHQAAGITEREFANTLTDNWAAIIDECPVPPLVAVDKDTDQVLGCLLPAPFPTDFGNIDTLPAGRKKIARLLQALENQYLQTNHKLQKALMVDIASVSRTAGGHGIYQQLRQDIQSIAANAGYTHIVGALSSAITQRVCVEKMQQKIVAEIIYQHYRDNGEAPFFSISHTRSIQLVVSNLQSQPNL
ncbi:MAG: hypothetical protein AAF404_13575 [Pseudomonadota bacterium]